MPPNIPTPPPSRAALSSSPPSDAPSRIPTELFSPESVSDAPFCKSLATLLTEYSANVPSLESLGMREWRRTLRNYLTGKSIPRRSRLDAILIHMRPDARLRAELLMHYETEARSRQAHSRATAKPEPREEEVTWICDYIEVTNLLTTLKKLVAIGSDAAIITVARALNAVERIDNETKAIADDPGRHYLPHET